MCGVAGVVGVVVSHGASQLSYLLRGVPRFVYHRKGKEHMCSLPPPQKDLLFRNRSP